MCNQMQNDPQLITPNSVSNIYQNSIFNSFDKRSAVVYNAKGSYISMNTDDLVHAGKQN